MINGGKQKISDGFTTIGSQLLVRPFYHGLLNEFVDVFFLNPFVQWILNNIRRLVSSTEGHSPPTRCPMAWERIRKKSDLTNALRCFSAVSNIHETNSTHLPGTSFKRKPSSSNF